MFVVGAMNGDSSNRHESDPCMLHPGNGRTRPNCLFTGMSTRPQKTPSALVVTAPLKRLPVCDCSVSCRILEVAYGSSTFAKRAVQPIVLTLFGFAT